MLSLLGGKKQPFFVPYQCQKNILEVEKMKSIREKLSNVSPFNNREDMSASWYVAKKLVAFIAIYILSAVVGEGIIIGIHYAMGYDPLHGIMPMGKWADLVPYYGMILFLAMIMLYCKLVEKRSIKSMGFNRKIADYLTGGLLAVVLLAIIIGSCLVTNVLSYRGINSYIDVKYVLALFIGIVIQGAAEEVLCRGFVMNSLLLKKISVPVAILASGTAFTLPHLMKMEADFIYVVIAIGNLYLVSAVFSLLALCRVNIWIACGLHSVWNFILIGMLGLTLSGNEAETPGILVFKTESLNIINGGSYGIEAGIATTLVLGVTVLILIKIWKKRRNEYGI